MEPTIHWNIALCHVVPTGTPFIMSNVTGMSSICPLKEVTLFILQLTRRSDPHPAAFINLPLSYDLSQNSLYVYMPAKMEQSFTSYRPTLLGIDGHLKQYCQQFKSSGNAGCVIHHAIRQLLSVPNFSISSKFF